MDMLYVDLSNNPENADIGSEVEMWGNHISVDDVAKNSGTVGYELLCNVSASSRVPLEYYRWPKVNQLFSAESVAATSSKWQGQCPHCFVWNSLDETIIESKTPSRFAALSKTNELTKLR